MDVQDTSFRPKACSKHSCSSLLGLQHTCVGAGGAAKVCRPIGTPQNKRGRLREAQREELLHIVYVARPRPQHLVRVEPRVPRAKLCVHHHD